MILFIYKNYKLNLKQNDKKIKMCWKTQPNWNVPNDFINIK